MGYNAVVFPHHQFDLSGYDRRAPGHELNLTRTIHRATVPLTAFRQRNFSLLWTSMTLVGLANQMEQVVLGWYVLTLTASPFLVGLVGSARMALNSLALFTGAIADRVPRQRLWGVESSMDLLGTGMLVLIISDRRRSGTSTPSLSWEESYGCFRCQRPSQRSPTP